MSRNRRPGLPLLSSVRGRIIAGFGLLVLILAAVVAGSAWLAREHRSDLAEMERHAAITSLLEEARFDATLANLLLERYVIAGNETAVPVIRSFAAMATDSLAEARANIEAEGREADVARLDEITAGAAFVSETSEQVIALRQSGDVQGARAALEAAAPRITQFGMEISEVAEQERLEVPALRSQADRTGDLAFWLLVISGVIGAALGLAASALVTRSILRPLSSLESSALAVAAGDLEARAQPTGPRELARLGASLNQMTDSLLDASKRREQEEQIKASLKEKEVLLKEIHHRVKNNLQVISSLLNLQAGSIKDQQAMETLKESQSRVKSLALIHEKLYQSGDLAKIDFAGYVLSLTADLYHAYGVNPEAIALRIDVDDVSLDIDTAIPCGLIINELVSNSLKHAFPADREGDVRIGLHSDDDDRLKLSVGDNGIGFPKDLDFRNTESLGLQVVGTLTDQLGGTMELHRNGGTEFAMTFPSVQVAARRG